jgi:hypothetical protein
MDFLQDIKSITSNLTFLSRTSFIIHSFPFKCFHAFVYSSSLVLLNYSTAPNGEFCRKHNNAAIFVNFVLNKVLWREKKWILFIFNCVQFVADEAKRAARPCYLTGANMKSSIFWDIKPCSPLKVNRCFGGTCCLHLHGGSRQNSVISLWLCIESLFACYMLHDGFLLDLFFHPEDWDDMFLRNISWLSADYTALYIRRRNSSYPRLWEPQILN